MVASSLRVWLSKWQVEGCGGLFGALSDLDYDLGYDLGYD